MSLILALRRQRQEDLCEFKASLMYRASSKTAKAIFKTEKHCLEKPKKVKPYESFRSL